MSKSVLITGASGGIGKQMVIDFLHQGYTVYAHYNKNKKHLLEIKNKNLILLKADLTKESQIKDLFKKLSSLDALILNAGIFETKHISFFEMTSKQWNNTLAVNLNSNFLLVREYGKLILKKKIIAPSIVVISSTAGTLGEAGHLDYATSKGALISGFLKTIKNELPKIAPKGRINAIAPSWTMTPMAQDFASQKKSIIRHLQTVAMKKIATTHDVSELALFLCDPKKSGHMTGQCIELSGGLEGRIQWEKEEIELQNLF
jgi:NAD(P)-dependent dehydrogenase (short-subunit alcohol dehydrogenase family)